jgi:tripartite-type tricarboxylate transporter receptor subunit TctC
MLPLSRRSLLGAALVTAATIGRAQSFPSRPIRLIVPFPPGGPTDIVGRLLAQKLSDGLGQAVVVENRAGAGGTIGADAVAKAPADGYTLLYGSTSTLAISPSVYRNLNYDPAHAFAPVGLVSRGQQLLVAHPSVPADSLQELVAAAKRNPNQFSYSSPGNGTPGPGRRTVEKSDRHAGASCALQRRGTVAAGRSNR